MDRQRRRPPVLPDYAEPASPASFRRCSTIPTSLPAWMPPRRSAPTRSSCSCSTARLGAVRGPPVARSPTLAAMERRSDHDGRARRPRPRRSRRSRPGCRPASTASWGTAWRSAASAQRVCAGPRHRGDARHGDPAARGRAARAVRLPAPADRGAGRVRALRLHAAPTSAAPGFVGYRMHVDAGDRGRQPAPGRRAVHLRLLRRHRQGRPRVRARRALRGRARSSIEWMVEYLVDVLPPTRRW